MYARKHFLRRGVAFTFLPTPMPTPPGRVEHAKDEDGELSFSATRGTSSFAVWELLISFPADERRPVRPRHLTWEGGTAGPETSSPKGFGNPFDLTFPGRAGFSCPETKACSRSHPALRQLLGGAGCCLCP